MVTPSQISVLAVLLVLASLTTALYVSGMEPNRRPPVPGPLPAEPELPRVLDCPPGCAEDAEQCPLEEHLCLPLPGWDQVGPPNKPGLVQVGESPPGYTVQGRRAWSGRSMGRTGPGEAGCGRRPGRSFGSQVRAVLGS